MYTRTRTEILSKSNIDAWLETSAPDTPFVLDFREGLDCAISIQLSEEAVNRLYDLIGKMICDHRNKI